MFKSCFSSALVWVAVCQSTIAVEPVGTNVLTALPDIVVTATRSPRDLQSVPYAVQRIDSVIATDQKGARTTPEVLEQLPSVMVQKTGHAQGSPYIRGFTGFRTLCLIDGIRLNNSVFRDGPNQYWGTVDPYSYASAELVLGPSSVLYGSDAIGGTMNVIPALPMEHDDSDSWSGKTLLRASTAEDSLVGRLELDGRLSDALGVRLGVTGRQFGDLEGGKDVGTQDHTGYDETDYDLLISYTPDTDSLITLGHQTVEQDDAWRTHRTIYGIDWEGLEMGTDKVHSFDQDRTLTWLKHRESNLGEAIDSLEWTISRHAQAEDLYRVRSDDRSDEQGFDVETLGASLELDSITDLGRFTYGTEYYHDDIDSYGRRYNADGSLSKTEVQGPVADDATYDSWGVYVQDAFQLQEDRVEVIPGLRYTRSSADADSMADPVTGSATTLEDDWDSVVASCRASSFLTDSTRHIAFAGISQGFRAPNMSDLTRLDTARSGEIETPSPDLDPEHFTTLDVGLRVRGDRASASFGAYHTWIDGMIVRTPTGEEIDDLLEVTKMNSGDGYIQGIEIEAGYELTRTWSTRMTGTLMDGRVDTYPTSDSETQVQDYISRLMPPTLSLSARWAAVGGRYWCEWVGDVAEKADKLSADDQRDTQRIPSGGTPGYIVAHLRTGMRVGDSCTLTAAIENLMDEDYRIHGSGVNEPGRNLIVTATYLF